MGISDLLTDALVLQQHLGASCQALIGQASEEEMEALCCRIGVDYHGLPTKGRARKARELALRPLDARTP